MRISDWSSDVCSSDLDRIARHAMQQGELAFDSFRVSQDCRFEAVIALHPDQYFQRRIRLGDLEKMGVQAIEFIRRNPTVYLERLDFVVARNAVDGLRVDRKSTRLNSSH